MRYTRPKPAEEVDVAHPDFKGLPTSAPLAVSKISEMCVLSNERKTANGSLQPAFDISL